MYKIVASTYHLVSSVHECIKNHFGTTNLVGVVVVIYVCIYHTLTNTAPYAGTSTIPRSWLQSPRKWANNRTPTNASAGGDLTPNSKRIATYYGTLQKPSKL